MTKRATVDMPFERAAAWQRVIADDARLAGRLAVYVIAGAGDTLTIGTASDKGSFVGDQDRAGIADRIHGGDTPIGYQPNVTPFSQLTLPEGQVGCLFISTKGLQLAAILPRVEVRLAAWRAEAEATDLSRSQDARALAEPALAAMADQGMSELAPTL